MASWDQPDPDVVPEPHPYLHEPLLYITNLPSYVEDQHLALAFLSCGPFRPKIQRDGVHPVVSGTIEFKFLEKAEKALAILQARPIPEMQPPVHLVLSPYPPTSPPTPLPPPSATPRLVKHLPFAFTDSQLYDIFRPFGALANARVQAGFGPDTGMVEFWREEDARRAEEAMHCAEVEGQNIAVQVYQPRRAHPEPGFNITAAPFIPSGNMFSYPGQYSPHSPHSPPRGSPYMGRSPLQQPLPFMHGPGQQVQLAPLQGPGSNSHSGLIDPCNLFCKNLDPSIDSNDLFTHFRQFGQIVSARVMRNENGDSRGFGFVSYQTPDQASAALHGMNGVLLGSKQVVVRLHEPKQLRQEKLAQRFSAGNGHPRQGSGATSPTVSEAGDSFGGWGSPRRQSMGLGSPVGSHFDRSDRGRRSSGSYYNAALSGTLNLPMRYDELSTLSPVVRKEVLTGELSRRVKALNSVPERDIERVVDTLVSLSLSDIVSSIDDPVKLAEHVKTLTRKELSPPSSQDISRSGSQDSRLLDPATLNATASAPDHPSTPISVAASLSTPPRTSSPSGSLAPLSERDRILAAVAKFEPSRKEELTDLLMSLPKRDRAMCLFNAEVLRAKIADAKMVLDSSDGEEAAAPLPVPSTPPSKKSRGPTPAESPQTPDLSSRGPSATASPAPTTPGGPVYTVASLGKLPAAEIVRMASSSAGAGLPLPKADPLVVKATDDFIDGLLDKPIQAQKQALGDKLWRIIKSFDIKGAPKLTIALLDQDDLRGLAHLMNSYPSVLKEKALLVQAAQNGRK